MPSSAIGAPGRRHQAARALSWGLLFFAGLQLALALSMEHWRPELRDLEYGGKRARLRRRLAEKPGHPLIVFLGSSRVNLGVRPNTLPPLPGREPVVFNYALMGAGPVLELVCLRRLLADGIRPDLVFVECWPPYWNQEGDLAEIHRIPITRLAWSDLEVLHHYSPPGQGLYRDWYLARAFPWSSSRYVLLTQFARGLLPHEERRDDLWQCIDPSGWLPYRGPTGAEQFRLRTDTSAGQFRPILRDYHLSPRADGALREFLSLCRREHIQAALLYMPESSAFRSWYPSPVREEVDRYLHELEQEYRVPLVDTRTWSPDEDFADGFHLLPRGAALFTNRFGREVLPRFLEQGLTPPACHHKIEGAESPGGGGADGAEQ